MNLGATPGETMLLVLAALLQRSGGEIVIGEFELIAAQGTTVVCDPDDASQLLTVTLVPDYVAVGVEEPKPVPVPAYKLELNRNSPFERMNVPIPKAKKKGGGKVVPDSFLDSFLEPILKDYHKEMLGRLRLKPKR